MKSILLFTSCIAATLAAPTQTWSPAMAEFYSAVDKHIQLARSEGDLTPPSCDLSKAVMPEAPVPLPAPKPDWKLSQVVVGRGVQNYTCAAANAQTTPVAIGAVANLYNVSCIAANYPDILSMLPGLALQYPLPTDPTAALEPSNVQLTGHHYFTGNGTPVFDLDYNPQEKLGVAYAKKAGNSTAPADAPKGENGIGNGAVPWLYLNSTFGTQGNIKGVYRVQTAGGNPPKTCESSPADFSVQYATQYWFYTGIDGK